MNPIKKTRMETYFTIDNLRRSIQYKIPFGLGLVQSLNFICYATSPDDALRQFREVYGSIPHGYPEAMVCDANAWWKSIPEYLY